ncbi:MAG: chemotaxis protein CheV [Gammaproteobacteria bacterium]|nr:chemotaxis protein CheV [Gammaproteobacteria bacterium]
MKPLASTQNHTTNHTHNRLELLLFRLDSRQVFGINVLKINEIIPFPTLTQLPQSHPHVKGIAELRGQAVPVVDLSQAIGRSPLPYGKNSESKVIITEFNRKHQGFIISGVDRILEQEWKDVLPPPHGASHSYITGVINTPNGLVQIIDVERVLGEIDPDAHPDGNLDPVNDEILGYMSNRHILVVDDSSVARAQTAKALEQMKLPFVMAKDGREALDLIHKHCENDNNILNTLPMLISDIEMPEMDGYQLTREVRVDSKLHDMFVLLHTSLDGRVNAEQAKQAGANATLTKFIPRLLADEILKGFEHLLHDK